MIAFVLPDVENGECEFLMFEQEALETSLIKDPLFRRVEALYVLFIHGKVQGLFFLCGGERRFLPKVSLLLSQKQTLKMKLLSTQC